MGKVLAACFFLFGVAVTAVSGADIFWRDYNGTIPYDALPTEHNVYIAQIVAKKNCGIVPATLYPTTRTAVSMVYFQKITATRNIKVLCTKEPNRFYWQPNIDLVSVPNCVVGGSENNHILYIGRVFHENQWKYGKIYDFNLHIWRDDGKPHVAQQFELLMFPDDDVSNFYNSQHYLRTP